MQPGDVLFQAARAVSAVRKPDVVFISNWRNRREMERAYVTSPPDLAWAQPVSWNGVKGQILVLGITSDELVTQEGKTRMTALFRRAVAENARENRVFLAAASTKSVMNDAETLRIVHDAGAIITDGNTMTHLMLETALMQMSRRNNWVPRETCIAVVGSKGRLGRHATDVLTRQGFNVIETTRAMDLDLSGTTASEVGVILCTHAFKGRVFENSHISRLSILDVAEPKGGRHLYETCVTALTGPSGSGASVEWLGVGYAFHPKLYIFLRYFLQLPRCVVFACFAEALSWGKWVKDGGNIDGSAIKIGGGHEDLVRQMLDDYEWKPHVCRIAMHGRSKQIPSESAASIEKDVGLVVGF